MAHVLITHEVENYEKWKLGFDLAASKRKEAGELNFQVLRYEQCDNKIVHFSQWQSIAQARSFFESEEVAKIREELGVKAPKFVYLEQLESGVL